MKKELTIKLQDLSVYKIVYGTKSNGECNLASAEILKAALGEKLGEVAVMPCPNCGEEGYENWVLSHRKRDFPKEDAANEQS